MSAADVALCPIHQNSGANSHRSKSIVLYLTAAGSVIPMHILESDSIATIKLKIQKSKGFVVKNQKLVFGGRELSRNNSLVKDYGVTNGDILHLVLKISDLLVITVETAFGKHLEIEVDRFRNIGFLKQKISEHTRRFGYADHEDQEIFCNGEKLHDQRVIDDVCKNYDAAVHLVIQKPAKVRSMPVENNLEISIEADESHRRPPDTVFLLQPIIVKPNLKLSRATLDMLKSASMGLEKGLKPIRSSEGTGGAYFLQHESGNRYVAVFKPLDEEPMAVNNPQGLPLSSNGEGLKRGTKVGEGALREVAAYLLDHPSGLGSDGEVGFAGVPPTVMVKCLNGEFNHPGGYGGGSRNIKVGSLQMFMENCGSCEDMGPSDFPVEEVHKITVLDIRTANADRHAGNILITCEGDRTVLVPIDHGYCLPENFEDCTFEWIYWPQARRPYSSRTLDYIKSLDAEKDLALLSSYGWNPPLACARTLRISTMLLKKGATRGLTPFTIAHILCRETLKKESVIEKIVKKANNAMLPGMSEAAFLEIVSGIMDFELNKLNHF